LVNGERILPISWGGRGVVADVVRHVLRGLHCLHC